ncbi:MAG: DUF6591 domain-containing protein [Ruminococcus sp.]
MKKRILALAVTICLLLSLGACGEKEEKVKTENNTITWATSGVGSLLPTPKFGNVDITYDSADSFSADITDITKEDFTNYVEECKKNGFTVDYSNISDSYYAKDNKDNSLSIIFFDDDETMNIMVTAKKNEIKTTTEKATKANNSSSGVNADFKKTLDSYEAFIDEYVAFMKKYNNSADVTSMMTDYANYVSKHAEVINELDKLEKEKDSLSAADCAYFVKVNARITKKLAEVAQ